MKDLVALLDSQPIQIQWDILIMGLFIATDILLVSWVFSSNKLKQFNLWFKSHFQNEVQNELVELIIEFCMESNPKVLRRLNHLSERSYIIRENILQQILSLNKSLSGESKDKLKQLYAELDLKYLSYDKLRSTKWKIAAKGVMEIEQMRPTDAIEVLQPLMNSSNQRLRKEVLLALVTLAPYPLFFLEKLKDELSPWDCIIVYNKLKLMDSRALPPFYKYYSHPLKSVKLFAINMTVRFSQYEGKEELIGMLKSRDFDIILATIEALEEMEIADAIPQVRRILRVTKSRRMALACLQYMGVVGMPEHTRFIEPYIHHPDGEIRSMAVKGLIELGYADFDQTSSETQELFKQFTFET